MYQCIMYQCQGSFLFRIGLFKCQCTSDMCFQIFRFKRFFAFFSIPFKGCSLCSLLCPFPPLSDMPLGRRSTSLRHICTKVLLAEGRESPFTEHCRDFEKIYGVLQTEVQKLKDEVQEMHRDLTMHHSLITTDTMDSILQMSLLIDQQIASLYSTAQTQRAVFEELWDMTFQRVNSEQEIYEAQLHDLLQLRQENAYLTAIARQIGPYILSITKVKERLEHRLQKPHSPDDDCMDTIKIKNVYQ
ncbi:RING finger protein 207 isoform X2 [Triplophysa dalaica]|uniref:RING finger protein 207 isoform X2 n=1 Tax=Triplophysa dalaica TaxID=1582913 RepID=UPI0024DFF92E|nr:RING finger protein 207 isoform X2 [Triplophysa dalaica]